MTCKRTCSLLRCSSKVAETLWCHPDKLGTSSTSILKVRCPWAFGRSRVRSTNQKARLWIHLNHVAWQKRFSPGFLGLPRFASIHSSSPWKKSSERVEVCQRSHRYVEAGTLFFGHLIQLPVVHAKRQGAILFLYWHYRWCPRNLWQLNNAIFKHFRHFSLHGFARSFRATQ